MPKHYKQIKLEIQFGSGFSEQTKNRVVDKETEWTLYTKSTSHKRQSKCGEKTYAGMTHFDTGIVTSLATLSGFAYKNVNQLTGGGKTQPGRQKNVSLKKSLHLWRHLVNNGNCKNLKDYGPFGQGCILIKMRNSKNNRKRLQTFFLRNQHAKPQHSSPSPSSFHVEKEKNVCMKDTKKTYCVCRKEWDEKEGCMVECENCGKWYHYKCILKHDVSINKYFVIEKYVRFICGLGHCKFREGVLIVKGTRYELCNQTEVSFRQWTPLAPTVRNTPQSVTNSDVDQSIRLGPCRSSPKYIQSKLLETQVSGIQAASAPDAQTTIALEAETPSAPSALPSQTTPEPKSQTMPAPSALQSQTTPEPKSQTMPAPSTLQSQKTPEPKSQTMPAPSALPSQKTPDTKAHISLALQALHLQTTPEQEEQTILAPSALKSQTAPEAQTTSALHLQATSAPEAQTTLTPPALHLRTKSKPYTQTTLATLALDLQTIPRPEEQTILASRDQEAQTEPSALQTKPTLSELLTVPAPETQTILASELQTTSTSKSSPPSESKTTLASESHTTSTSEQQKTPKLESQTPLRPESPAATPRVVQFKLKIEEIKQNLKEISPQAPTQLFKESKVTESTNEKRTKYEQSELINVLIGIHKKCKTHLHFISEKVKSPYLMKHLPLKMKHSLKTMTQQVQNVSISEQSDWYDYRKQLLNVLFSMETVCSTYKGMFIAEEVPFSRKLASDILGMNVNKQYLTKIVPKDIIKVNFSKSVFNLLKKTQFKRCFRKGSWEKYFIDKITESNPFCVFNFKYHFVSNATKRKVSSGSCIFQAKASCKFKDCSCIVLLKMFNENTLYLSFNGSIKHSIYEFHHRNLSGSQRNDVKQVFRQGAKPLNVFLEKFGKVTKEQIEAGNMTDIGLNSHKLAQIACESRSSDRCDINVIKSILIQRKKFNLEIPGGFIQKISVEPMYILYWTDAGLKLYNNLAGSTNVFWDATGSVVRKSENGKRFLYYEMAISNPVKGKMGIPISAMVTENHSLPVVLDWLRSYRHAEKKAFGHSNMCTPRAFISDQSMVFILAALQEFNNETLALYLNRCWRIVNGKGKNGDFKKSLILLCKGHFFHTIKNYLKKKDVSKQKISFCLYIVGLLSKCLLLKDLENVLYDTCLTLQSKYIHEQNQFYIERLLQKISNFDPSTEVDKPENNELKHEEINEGLNPNMFTEEQFILLSSDSPFKLLAESIKRLSEDKITHTSHNTLKTNSFYCQVFLDYLIKNLMPLYPAWSSIMHESLESARAQDVDITNYSILKETNSTIENRFRILKHIALNGHTKHRLDEFSEHLKKHTIGIQNLAVINYLKSSYRIKRKRKQSVDFDLPEISTKIHKKSVLISEHWNKKNKFVDVTGKTIRVGKYQKPPSKPFILDANQTNHSLENEFKSEDTKTDVFYLKDITQHSSCVRKVENGILEKTSEQQSIVSPQVNSITITKPKESKEINTIAHHVFQKGILKTNQEHKVAICKLKNFGSTCWFNSLVQGFCHSNLSNRLIEICQDQPIQYIDSDNLTEALESVLDLWIVMKANHGECSHHDLLLTSVKKVCALIPNFSLHKQQDVHECVVYLFNQMSNIVGDKLTLQKEVCCKCCGYNKQNIEDMGPSIYIYPSNKYKQLSVEQLIQSDFLADEEIITVCLKCKQDTNHNIIKSISKLPRTLSIVLGRCKFSENNKTASKIKSEVQFRDVLVLYSENYRLKAAVCHIGENTTCGHYVTVLNVEGKYILCDDTNINEVSKEFILDKSVIFVYDTDIDPLPSYIKEFLLCISRTDVFKKCVRDTRFNNLPVSNKALMHSLSNEIISNDEECFIQRGVQKHSKGDMIKEELCALTLNHVFNNVDYENSSLLEEHLAVQTIDIFQCKACCIQDNKIHTSLISHLQDFKQNSFEESVKSTEVPLKCTCGKFSRKTYFVYFPTCLIYAVHHPAGVLSYLPRILNFSNYVFLGMPINSMKYSLQSILYYKDSVCFTVFNKNGHFIKKYSSQPFCFKEIKDCEFVMLFYKKMTSAFRLDVIRKTKPLGVPTSTFPCAVDFQLPLNIPKKAIMGVKLTREFYSSILLPSTWMTSDHINVYLAVLAKMNNSSHVHMVDSSWFSDRLIKNRNPQQIQWYIGKTESTNAWFQYEYIVIPVNENNKHWILCVVDIYKRLIYFCNSYGTSASTPYVIMQIWRYLCFESLVHSSVFLEKDKWSCVFYHETEGFPKQSDTDSCGVYICAVTHAILSNKRLPPEPNLYSYRKLMALNIFNTDL